MQEIKKYQKPVLPQQIIRVTIQNYGNKGDGIARIPPTNYVIIIPNTKIDQQYLIKINKVFDKYAIAEPILNLTIKNEEAPNKWEHQQSKDS